MTIDLQPEDERLVNDAVRSGQYVKAEDVISDALAIWRRQRQSATQPSEAAVHTRAQNLVELFEAPPFRGLEINFERDPDTGRDVEL